MKGQVFQKNIPETLLWQFINAIHAEDAGLYFIVSNAEYKRAQLQMVLPSFLAQLYDYYLPSKRHFISKSMSYYKMMTIVRQICNANAITYERKMKYDKSTYEIIYYIYKTPPAITTIALAAD